MSEIIDYSTPNTRAGQFAGRGYKEFSGIGCDEALLGYDKTSFVCNGEATGRGTSMETGGQTSATNPYTASEMYLQPTYVNQTATGVGRSDCTGGG